MRCSLEMFAGLKCDELHAFIMARQDRDKPEFTAKSKIPKKGTLKDAALGERKKILIAFDSRVLKNVFTDSLPYNITMTDKVDGSAIDQLGILSTSLGQEDEERVLPSHLLSDDRWVGLVVDFLDLENMNITKNITHQQKEKADHLVKILQNRFKQHLVRRIKDNIKRMHWSMQFASNNLAVSAACMVLSNHIKKDIKCIQDGDCILVPNTHNFYQCSLFPNREGAYLYFDSNKGCFVRSGKVTRPVFSVRGKENFEGSMKIIAGSNFYDMYPALTCSRAHNRGTRGTFDDLQQVIAAGWSPTSDTAMFLDRSRKDGGLLVFNEREKKQIRASMEKGLTDIQKFHDMCAYQFEMGYDLAISPGCNVSQSPGFESVLGIYGGQ